ncbi:MAG: hypothetical protein K8L99_17595 [Anaerolineae bacterium]|nr:hypothetical protein [Anaerolineae bacterium]
MIFKEFPDSMLAQPMDYTVPVPQSQCCSWLEKTAQQSGLSTRMTAISETSVRFNIRKHISRVYAIEATGYVIRRSDSDTIVVGQVRISPYTYALAFGLALLSLLLLQSVFALLFALLFLRLVMALVISGSVCKMELAQLVEDALNQAVRARKSAVHIPEVDALFQY